MYLKSKELEVNVVDILQRCDEIAVEILEGEIEEISKHLNISPWNYTFHRFNDVSFIDPVTNRIRFKFDDTADFDRMIVTLAHELRHQMQFEVMNSNKDNPKKEEWIKAYQDLISTKDSYQRICNPLEIDAAAYSVYYARAFHNAKLNIKNKEIELVIEKYIKENFRN